MTMQKHTNKNYIKCRAGRRRPTKPQAKITDLSFCDVNHDVAVVGAKL